jgi:hypothetical protein
MKIKEVYEIMDSELGSWLLANGYKKKAGRGRPLWVKPIGKRYQLIHFFGDPISHYERPFGGEFGMKAILGNKPEMSADNWNHARCLMGILDDHGLKRMTALRDKILRKILRQKQQDMSEFERVVFRSMKASFKWKLDDPYQSNWEEYFPYLDSADVKEWCRFIKGMLPKMDEAITG